MIIFKIKLKDGSVREKKEFAHDELYEARIKATIRKFYLENEGASYNDISFALENEEEVDYLRLDAANRALSELKLESPSTDYQLLTKLSNIRKGRTGTSTLSAANYKCKIQLLVPGTVTHIGYTLSIYCDTEKNIMCAYPISKSESYFRMLSIPAVEDDDDEDYEERLEEYGVDAFRTKEQYLTKEESMAIKKLIYELQTNPTAKIEIPEDLMSRIYTIASSEQNNVRFSAPPIIATNPKQTSAVASSKESEENPRLAATKSILTGLFQSRLKDGGQPLAESKQASAEDSHPVLKQEDEPRYMDAAKLIQKRFRGKNVRNKFRDLVLHAKKIKANIGTFENPPAPRLSHKQVSFNIPTNETHTPINYLNLLLAFNEHFQIDLNYMIFFENYNPEEKARFEKTRENIRSNYQYQLKVAYSTSSQSLPRFNQAADNGKPWIKIRMPDTLYGLLTKDANGEIICQPKEETIEHATKAFLTAMENGFELDQIFIIAERSALPLFEEAKSRARREFEITHQFSAPELSLQILSPAESYVSTHTVPFVPPDSPLDGNSTTHTRMKPAGALGAHQTSSNKKATDIPPPPPHRINASIHPLMSQAVVSSGHVDPVQTSSNETATDIPPPPPPRKKASINPPMSQVVVSSGHVDRVQTSSNETATDIPLPPPSRENYKSKTSDISQEREAIKKTRVTPKGHNAKQKASSPTSYSNLLNFMAAHPVITASAALVIAAGVTAALIGFGAIPAGSGYVAFLTSVAGAAAPTASTVIAGLGVGCAVLTAGTFTLYGTRNKKFKEDDLNSHTAKLSLA